MPSPFPGMDPYLEHSGLWSDVHQSLAIEIRDQLAPLIRPNYFAAVNPRVAYDEIVLETRPAVAFPDVGIWAQRERSGRSLVLADIAPAPLIGHVPVEEPVKLFAIEVRDREHRVLVTSIELLSPVNKRPGHRAWDDYQRKRKSLLRRGVNLVEIDLVRSGQRTPPLLEPMPPVPYVVFLTRGMTPDVEIWPIRLQDALPVIPVPLRDVDGDVPLDLGLAIGAIYDRAWYGDRIDYRDPPPAPALSSDDARWLDRHLRPLRSGANAS